MKVLTLRILLVPAEGTHFMCAVCGSFRTDYVIEPAEGQPQVGVHKGCVEKLRAGQSEEASLRREATGRSE